MSESNNKLYLLDAYALIYRAYYAFIKNPRVNSKGLNTSAIFGFCNSLFDVINNNKPGHLAVAFDPSGLTFRSTDYAEYKANREETPNDIKLSIPYIKSIVKALRIPVLEIEGYEADDVIGTIAKKAERAGYITYMMTPDKDYGQLVSENIFIHKPARMGNDSEILGVAEVCKRFEIENPLQVIDLLGLMGDAVDNIPGVPGVGEKTAIKLIKQYGSIENIYENINDQKGKLKENLENNKEKAFLSKKLATIILDVPVDFEPDKLIMEKPDADKLKEIFSELEFKTLAARILGEKPTAIITKEFQTDLFSGNNTEEIIGEATVSTSELNDINTVEKNYKIIDTKDKRENFIELLLKQKSVCFDTETTGLEAYEAELVGISFSFKENEGYYLPIPENQTAAKFIVTELQPFFNNINILKIGHNLKYDVTILKNYGIEISMPMFDTMLAHYLIQPDMRHGMDYLSEVYLKYKPVSIETLIGKKGVSQKSMRQVGLEEISKYAAEDADVTYQLYKKFLPLLIASGSKALFDDIEMPLMPVLADMEKEGVKIDIDVLKSSSKEIDIDIVALEKSIYEIAGVTFNIASPKQLGEVLFDRMKIMEKAKKTKTGAYATNEETLIKLADKHPIINYLLDFRELKKLKSTYIDSLPLLVSKTDNRIHTTYMQAVASTGRLSSQQPNLQNIPIRTQKGKEIRKAFVPKNDDYTLLSADYSQIELRIIAELSGDEGMLDAFVKGEDIHNATASKVFDLPIEKVTKEMRNQAKTVNFGIIYGISAFGLSQRINISRTEAANLISQYFLKYPGIKKYMEENVQKARENGYVETIMKRKRYLPDINSANAVVRGFAERNAINAPIQGSAADMIKIAMIKIQTVFKKNNYKSKMILQVHDELVFDTHITEVDIIKPIIIENMQNAIKLKVPIIAEVGTGKNWLEAH
jgi:DNA polymerase I